MSDPDPLLPDDEPEVYEPQDDAGAGPVPGSNGQVPHVDWTVVEQHAGWLKTADDLPEGFSAKGRVIVAHHGTINDLNAALKKAGLAPRKPYKSIRGIAFALASIFKQDQRFTLEQIAADAIQQALAGGASDAECTISEGEEFSVSVRMREVENLKEAGSRGAGIRVLTGEKGAQRAGSSYTSDLSPEGIDWSGNAIYRTLAALRSELLVQVVCPLDSASGSTPASHRDIHVDTRHLEGVLRKTLSA